MDFKTSLNLVKSVSIMQSKIIRNAKKNNSLVYEHNGLILRSLLSEQRAVFLKD